VWSSKICKAFLWSLAFSLAFRVFTAFAEPAAVVAPGMSLMDAAGVFLRELGTPEPVRLALLEPLRKSGGESASRAVETESGVYSFSAGAAPLDKDEDVRRELEASAVRFHGLRARRELALRLAKGQVNRARYPDDEALGGAISSYYGDQAAGTQLASDVAGGWAMALAWLTPEGARAARETIAAAPELGQEKLSDAYCTLLYQRARGLFEAGRYSEALPVFKHIHDFRWANVGAYTDAAECFLRTGEPEECVKLLKDLLAVLGDGMGSGAFERAGRLFREAGDRPAALEAFKMARERLREGK
jgi:tetratricopeptide (TPR) repeat protein